MRSSLAGRQLRNPLARFPPVSIRRFCATKPAIAATRDRSFSRGSPMAGGGAHGRLAARLTRRASLACGMAGAALALAAGAGSSVNDQRTTATPPPQFAEQPPSAPSPPNGEVRVALILLLSAQGNAGIAAQSMKNAAEMALAEFKQPNVQLLIKDDAGNPHAAQTAAQQAVTEGAEIIVGPLFAQAVSTVGSVARARGVPVIAFSTDTSVAAPGVYLLSFLPESDVGRIVDYAFSRGKRSFAALLPEKPYGSVVEAAFQ